MTPDIREQVREQAAKVAENAAREAAVKALWHPPTEDQRGRMDCAPKNEWAFVQIALDTAAAAIRSMPLPDLPGVPDGYKIVPIEPTEEMRKRGYDAFIAAHDPFYSKNEPSVPIWRAMLAAAPLPPASTSEKGGEQ